MKFFLSIFLLGLAQNFSAQHTDPESERFLTMVEQSLNAFYGDYANSTDYDSVMQALNYEANEIPSFSDEVYCMYSEAMKTVHDTADRLGQKVNGHAEGTCVEWPGVLCGRFKCHLRAIYTLVMTPLHIRKVEVPDEWKNALAQDILDAKVPLDVLPETLISLVQQLRMNHYHIHHESHAHIIRYCVPNTMHYHYFTITPGLKEDYHLKGKVWL